jgi:hypothetical protein
MNTLTTRRRTALLAAPALAALGALSAPVSAAPAPASSSPAASPATAAPVDAASTAAAPQLSLKGLLGPCDDLPKLPEDTWTIALQPRAWYVAHRGDLTLPGAAAGPASTKIDVKDLALDKSRISPYGTLDIQADHLLIALSGANLSISQASTAPRNAQLGTVGVTAGDALDAKLETTIVQVMAGWRVMTYVMDDAGDTALRLHALGGVRYYAFDTRLARVAGGVVDVRHSYADAIIGARAGLVVARDFGLDVDLNAGAGSGTSVEIAAAFSYRPSPLPWLALQVGYRNVFLNASSSGGNEKFEFDGSLAGLFFGASIRF